MEILLLVFFIAAAGLAFYAFLPGKSEKQPEILTGIIPPLGHQEAQVELQTANQIISDLERKNTELSEQIKALEAKCESCAAKQELEEVKKKLENAEQVLRIVHGV